MAGPMPLADSDDADLVRRAIAGQRDAFAEIYHRYHTVVYRFARMMSGSRTIAEDVTQETFTTLLQDLPRYAPRRARLSTYLYGVARNVTRSRLRRERRFVRLDIRGDNEPVSARDPCAALDEWQRKVRLRRIIAELPSRYREVIILCCFHGLSYAEVSIVLRTPTGTVRSRLSRARHAIADRLRELEESPGVLPARTARCVV
jgi:RNA polymerase sigma-70 factor, ECF subfamily